MLYLIIISLFTILAILLGSFIGAPIFGYTVGEIITKVFIVLGALFLLNLVACIFVRYCLPKKFFNPLNKFHKVHKWERKFYEKLGVRKWKDKIPEMGKILVGFNKTEIGDMQNNSHILKFMEETVYAEYIHLLSGFIGILVAFIETDLFLFISLPYIIGNLIINIMPIIVQRYNRPKLMILYERNIRKQNMEQ